MGVWGIIPVKSLQQSKQRLAHLLTAEQRSALMLRMLRHLLMALADVSGVKREVNIACIADRPLTDLVGEWALIHVGFAMARIDAEEAARTLDALRDLGEAQEVLEAMRAGDTAMEPAS